jgi:predicted nuclease of restriction endonuclease-like RecB superfamily
MTKEQIEAILEDVRSWPPEYRQELAEAAREIQARREGLYKTTAEERAAIARGQASPLVGDDEVAAFWKERGIG